VSPKREALEDPPTIRIGPVTGPVELGLAHIDIAAPWRAGVGGFAALTCVQVDVDGLKDHVSLSRVSAEPPERPDPPLKMMVLEMGSYAIFASALALGTAVLAGALMRSHSRKNTSLRKWVTGSATNVLTSRKTQVSPRKSLVPLPPNITALPVFGSNAILAAERAGGRAPVLEGPRLVIWVQSVPFHVQVSPNTPLALEIPPNITTTWPELYCAITGCWRAGGMWAGDLSVQSAWPNDRLLRNKVAAIPAPRTNSRFINSLLVLRLLETFDLRKNSPIRSTRLGAANVSEHPC
jgi:hypothetical protein